MPQQINLCTPIFQTQKRYFSTQTMVQALAVFVLLAGGLCAYWVWSLNALTVGYQKSVTVNQREIDRLQTAIRVNKASAGPADAALVQELQARRAELQQRQQLLEDFRRGLVREGGGHAARLQLLAQSIPSQVWVTEVKADESWLELRGFTLEPALLNDWMGRLATHPLLQGQKLSAVKVERAGEELRQVAGAAVVPSASASMPVARAQPPAVWSFTLVSAMATPVAPAVSASGAKP